MVNPRQAGTSARRRIHRIEFDVPDPAEFALVIKEVDDAAADTADREDRQLAGTMPLLEGIGAEHLCPRHRRRRVVDLEPDRVGGCAVHQVGGMREPLFLRVDHDVDSALAVKCDVLVLVARRAGESERQEKVGKLLRLTFVVGELYEFDPLRAYAIRHGGHVDRDLRLSADDPVHEIDERAATIDGDRLRRAAPELVVEDFERKRTRIARGGDGPHEVHDRQVALSGHVAEMAAPVEEVHVDQRRIGELHQEDSIAKNLIVWVKEKGGMGTFHRSRHELIFAFKKGTAPHINSFELGRHGRYRTNVWQYRGMNTLRAGRLDELALHPTVKPVQLIADAIKDVSGRGALVLDLFGGSGSTLIATHKTGRRCFVAQLDPIYCDRIIRRGQPCGLPD